MPGHRARTRRLARPQIGTMRRFLQPELQHYFGSFLLQTAMMAGMTLIPFFCFQHLGGETRSAALAYGVQTLSLGITCFFSALFVHRWKNGLHSCSIGSVGFGAFYFFASYAHSIASFCILTAIAMCFFGLAWPALQSWLGAQPNEQKRMRSFSWFNVALGLGLTVGPLAGGAFYRLSVRAAFAAVFLLSVFAAALLFTLPQERVYFSRRVAAAEGPEQTAGSEDPLPISPSRLNETFLYCGWLTNMLGWGLTGAVRTVYAGRIGELVQQGQLVLLFAGEPSFASTTHGITAATLYSEMQAVLSLGYFAAILVLGRSLRWQRRIWVLLSFEALLGLAIWTLAGSRSLLVIFACHAVLGAFTAFGYFGSQTYSASNYALKHRRIAIQEGLSQSSGFVLPLLFAQSATLYGIASTFNYVWLLLAVFAFAQLLSLQFAKFQLHRSFGTQPAC